MSVCVCMWSFLYWHDEEIVHQRMRTFLRESVHLVDVNSGRETSEVELRLVFYHWIGFGIGYMHHPNVIVCLVIWWWRRRRRQSSPAAEATTITAAIAVRNSHIIQFLLNGLHFSVRCLINQLEFHNWQLCNANGPNLRGFKKPRAANGDRSYSNKHSYTHTNI